MKSLPKLTCLWLCLALLLSACNRVSPLTPAPGSTTPAPAADTQPAVPPVPTVTPTITASPTPPPGRVLLLAPAGVDPGLLQAVQPVLEELAAVDGLQFNVLPELPAAEITPALRLVVALPPDPGVADLAASAPGVQFLAVEIPGLAPAPNLSLLSPGGPRLDQQAFMAGYLAAVLTAEWRVGVILPDFQPAGALQNLAFYNGAVFFCGLCRPAYPPFVQYPISLTLPLAADQADMQGLVAELTGQTVKTVYVAAGAEDEYLLAALVQAGLQLIGAGPPPAAAQSQWVASLVFDRATSLRALWPALLAGQGGANQDWTLALAHINEVYFSPGRQELVRQTLTELQAGWIGTGADPQSGVPLP